MKLKYVVASIIFCIVMGYAFIQKHKNGMESNLIKKFEDLIENVSLNAKQLSKHSNTPSLLSNEDLVKEPFKWDSNNAREKFKEVIKKPSMTSQFDPRLIKLIQEEYLVPPTNKSLSLNTAKKHGSQFDEDEYIFQLIRHQRDGFFIECGAYYGLEYSNTILLETFLGWNGLLIEGGANNFKKVVNSKRNAWLSHACLSLNTYPEEVTFTEYAGIGGVILSDFYKKNANQQKSVISQVQCIPLFSYLLALNQTTIDYFSLDVEGGEFDILKTIPWDLVKIKTISVEYFNTGGAGDDLLTYMESKGYKLFHHVKGHDYILYHTEYIKLQ